MKISLKHTSIIERTIETTFPCFLKDTRLSGTDYIMFTDPTTAIKVNIFTYIEGAQISTHKRFEGTERDEIFSNWQPATQKEFASVLQRATEQIEAHFPKELKTTIKEISY